MAPRVFTIHYQIVDPSGAVMEDSRDGDPLTFMEGAGQILPDLEAGVLALKAGQKASLDIASDHAFGPREEGRVVKVQRNPGEKGELQIGQTVALGKEQAPATVIDVTGAYYIVDANHPFAGMDLRFDIEVLAVRPATAEEIQHGHAHGQHGHGH